MGRALSQQTIFRLIGAVLVISTLTTFPTVLTHPYSVAKLPGLVAICFALVPIISAHAFNMDFIEKHRIVLAILSIHFAWGIVVLLMPQNNFLQELYGIWGRNNGFLSHLSYLIIFVGSLILSNRLYISNLMYIAVATGWIALIYGLLQAYSLVSIDSISGSNNRSTSFFGNTNFHSSFIGIVATIALSLGLQNQTNTLRRLYLISFCAIAPFAISKSDSQQGFLVIFIGFSVVIFEYFRIRFRPIFSRVFGLSSLVVLTLISFGLFQRGPLEELVYEESISSRGFYMRAGIKMFTDNPIFGVGYDGYRDWYRRSRGEEALASSSLGAKDISDSAHNYFIDVAASGGVVFGLSLIILWIYIFFCAFKILQRSTKFEGISIAVVASFAAFTTQLFISLPQIGLTVWGWSLGGLVVAIYLNKGEEVFQKNYIYKLKPKMIIASFTLFTLGLVLTIPVFYSSYEYRKSIETQDVQRLQRAALLFPREANMLSASGGALIGIEEYEKAKQLLTVAKDTFPQFFESWYLYSLLPNITTQELSNAKIKMSQLEPLLSEDMDEQIEK